MFGIGFGELIIILLIAVVVVGPEHLPEMAQKAGKTINDLRRMYDNLRSELGPDFEEVERQVRNLRSLDPRRELENVGKRVLSGLTEEVPELATLNESALRGQISQLQTELRDTVLHPRDSVAKTYDSPTTEMTRVVDPYDVNTYTHDAIATNGSSNGQGHSILPAARHEVVERRQTLGRLAHSLLNDDVLDVPIGRNVSGAAERRQVLGRLGHQLLNDAVLDEPIRDDAVGRSTSL